MAIAGTQLIGLFGATGGGDLLRAAYGLAAQTASANAGNAVAALRQAERGKSRDIARTAAQPEVKRDIAAFRVAVARAGSAEALLRDPAAMKVLLTANGLASHLAHTALARKALLSDINNAASLANKLPDTRWKATAQTYDFAHQGLVVLRDPKVMATLEGAYAEVRWRETLDATTPGLSDALTFRAQAGKIGSALEILGDPILRRVVTTTLGLPQQIAFQTIEAQEKAITARLDVSRLGDSKFAESFAQRFLIARSQDQAAASDDALTLARRSAGLFV